MAKKKDKNSDWLVKAYNNSEFLNSPPARIIRILSEVIEPETRFRKHKVRNTVVFFGSARTLSKSDALKNLKKIQKEIKTKKSPSRSLKQKLAQAERDLSMARYYEDAAIISEKLTRWFKKIKNDKKQFIICSGGGPGIMEAANRGAKKANGKSVGLNISLPMEQNPNIFQDKELAFEFHYFFIRKFWFFYLAKSLVVFPGGFGTMDEFFELLTLIQTEKSKKYMPVVLYGSEYWNKVVNFDEMVKWGMISKSDLKLFKTVDDPESAFKYLKAKLTKHYL
ncbi:MAG: LOG family protein [PVC group bacterium]|nr:LOG family protein [PVC group bacterium]